MTRSTPHWLTAANLAGLLPGVAIAVETTGRHDKRLIGRILLATSSTVELNTPQGDIVMAHHRIKRARIVEGLYAPGDPVLKRHVSAATWRGGVVRTEGTDVLVEQIGGDFAWVPESDLEPADARDPVAPKSPRGPVPAGPEGEQKPEPSTRARARRHGVKKRGQATSLLKRPANST